MSKAIKLSDLVEGSTFKTEMGDLVITKVEVDGYSKGDDKITCTLGDTSVAKANGVQPFTFADDRKELKSFINTHKIKQVAKKPEYQAGEQCIYNVSN